MPKSKVAASETTRKSRKAATAKPTYDEIALRAYHIYLERGCTPGDPMQDWLPRRDGIARTAEESGPQVKSGLDRRLVASSSRSPA